MNGLNLQSRKVWLAGSALVALLIVAIAWFFAIGPMRSSTDSLRSQTADTVVQNSQLDAKVAALTRQSSKLPAYRAALARAAADLPSDPDLPTFTRSLTTVARRAQVTISNITVGTVSAPTAAAATAASTSTPAASDSSSTDSSSTASSASTAEPTAYATTAPPTQLSVAMTLQISGSRVDDLAFLEAIRKGERSAMVTSVQLSTSGATTTVTAALTLFSAHMSSSQIAGLRHLLASGK